MFPFNIKATVHVLPSEPCYGREKSHREKSSGGVRGHVTEWDSPFQKTVGDSLTIREGLRLLSLSSAIHFYSAVHLYLLGSS